MVRTSSKIGFDIYFRSSYARAQKRGAVAPKKHSVSAKGAHRRRAHAAKYDEIMDDELPEPSVTPKDDRMIWN